MTAIELKEAALYFLRFERGLTHICTEFGQYSADVAGASDTRFVEIETKISLSDLRNDFKKRKHQIYLLSDMVHGHRESDFPNYFYFMVPKELTDEAIKLCEEKNKSYGVITYAAESEYWVNRFKVSRRGKKIHTRKPSEKVLSRMASRMANEIVTAHMLKHRVYEMRTHLVSELKNRFDNPCKDEIFEEEV